MAKKKVAPVEEAATEPIPAATEPIPTGSKTAKQMVDIAGGGIVRDSKRLCPTFDPKYTYCFVVPLPYKKVLPRVHYFTEQPSGWYFGEGCAEMKVGALKHKDIPGFGRLTHRLERIVETDVGYCHEYTLIEPQGTPPVTAGQHDCYYVHKNSDDPESTIIMYSSTWSSDDEALDKEVAEMVAEHTPDGVKRDFPDQRRGTFSLSSALRRCSCFRWRRGRSLGESPDASNQADEPGVAPSVVPASVVASAPAAAAGADEGERLEKLFRLVDRDQSGAIDFEEFTAGIHLLGFLAHTTDSASEPVASKEQMREWFDDADDDGSGLMELNEFITMMKVEMAPKRIERRRLQMRKQEGMPPQQKEEEVAASAAESAPPATPQPQPLPPLAPLVPPLALPSSGPTAPAVEGSKRLPQVPCQR